MYIHACSYPLLSFSCQNQLLETSQKCRTQLAGTSLSVACVQTPPVHEHQFQLERQGFGWTHIFGWRKCRGSDYFDFIREPKLASLTQKVWKRQKIKQTNSRNRVQEYSDPRFHMFFPCIFIPFSTKEPSNNLGHQPRGSALLPSNHSFLSQARWESPSFLCISVRKDRGKNTR